jgi:hypothetical protein
MRQMLFVSALVLVSATAYAQEAATDIKIEDLRAPASPAFVLLDVTPAAVERPQNPKAVVLNVLSSAAKAEGFPQDYALQAAPYWLMYHPDLQFDDYLDPGRKPCPAGTKPGQDCGRDVLRAIAKSTVRTFSVSVATSPLLSDTAEATKIGSRLGIGFSSLLLGGRPNPRMADAIAKHDQALDAVLNNPASQAARDAARQAALKVQELDQQRQGFIVHVAGGQAWNFPNDAIEESTLDRWGIWVTPTYRLLNCGEVDCQSAVDFIAVLRTLYDKDGDRWDFGGRLLWEPTNEFNVSAEFVRRKGRNGNDESSDRTVGMVEYQIRDGLTLFGSFGKDFPKDDAVERRTLLSIIGVNFGFGTKTAK